MRITSILDDDALNVLMNEPTTQALVCFLEFATLSACSALRLTNEIGATPLRSFIARILYYSQTPFNVILAVPVHLGRLGASLRPGANGSSSTPHRMFFGCLVLTTKYLLDVSPGMLDWVAWLSLSCNNFFLSADGIAELELEILKRCQWRADIHEHDFLQALHPLRNFLSAALRPPRPNPRYPHTQANSDFTEYQLNRINTYVAQIRRTCERHPCLLCKEGEALPRTESRQYRSRL